MHIRHNTKGFTLIELLVVIAIIGVLSSIVLSSINKARNRALIEKAKQEMLQIVKAIEYTRAATGKPLLQITGSGCTYCTGTDAAYTDSMQDIMTASEGSFSGLDKILIDPWGVRYMLDENEGESGTSCLPDYIKTSNNKVVYYFAQVTSACISNPQGHAPGWVINYN